jgi:hypothetical protein
MTLLSYVGQRAALSIPVFLSVVTTIFFVVRVLPAILPRLHWATTHHKQPSRPCAPGSGWMPRYPSSTHASLQTWCVATWVCR